MKVVATEKAPKALGPYSQGYVHNGIFYSAGQIPINPETDAVEADTIEDRQSRYARISERFLKQQGLLMTK